MTQPGPSSTTFSLGGAFEAIEEIKGRLVRSLSERTRRIESGEQVVVGVNVFTESALSPLEGEESILRVDPQVEADMVADARRLAIGASAVRRGRSAARARGRRRVRDERDAGNDRVRTCRRDDRRVGADFCVTSSASIGRPREWVRRSATATAT